MAGAQSANQRRAAALSSAVGFVVRFVPWIVYWILVGNAPFLVAVLAGLGLSVAINAMAHAGSIKLGGTAAGLTAAQADMPPRVICLLAS
jgi:hypothetical protein